MSADWNANVGLALLVGLFGLLTMVGSGSCAANGTLKTRPWPAGKPSAPGSSPTKRLPCGSTVSESTTSYWSKVPLANEPWLEKVPASPV